MQQRAPKRDETTVLFHSRYARVSTNFRGSVGTAVRFDDVGFPLPHRAISRIDTVITGSVVVAGYHVL